MVRAPTMNSLAVLLRVRAVSHPVRAMYATTIATMMVVPVNPAAPRMAIGAS